MPIPMGHPIPMMWSALHAIWRVCTSPWMAANSTSLISAMLDGVWMILIILGIPVCRVSAHRIQGANTLCMGSKGRYGGW